MSEAVTRGIVVRVESRYEPEHSEPDQSRYLFSYTVRIENRGQRPAQLISRRWIITDANGGVEEVEGPGVVGYQPHLRPGESFEYTSSCPLRTPLGTMRGTYRMLADGGDAFDATIAPFDLAAPTLPVN